MAKHKRSLLRQLTLGLSLAIVFLSITSFYYQYQQQRAVLLQKIQDDARAQATMLRLMLGRAKEEYKASAQTLIGQITSTNDTKQKIIITDKDKKVIASNTGLNDAGQEVINSSLSKVVQFPGAYPQGDAGIQGEEYIIAMPFFTDTANKHVAGGILLYQPLTPMNKLANSLMLSSFGLLACTLGLIILVIYYVLKDKVHKPMQAIFMQQYRIREGDLVKIEAEDPNNEFSDLYAMYNEMVVRIAEQKKAILEQKDVSAVSAMSKQALRRLAGPIEDILIKSKLLLDPKSSLSEADKATLRGLIVNLSHLSQEMKQLVSQGEKSTNILRREAAKVSPGANGATKKGGDGSDIQIEMP